MVLAFYLQLIAHHFIVTFLTVKCKLTILEFVGLNFSIVAAYSIIKCIINTIHKTWIRSLLSHNLDLKSLGSWAVVTGATDGIGLAYCSELAKRGINIVLVSRSIEKLQKCSQDLKKNFEIQTILIEMDFTGEIDKYTEVISKLQSLEIGILINNVGMTYQRPTRFDEVFAKKNFVRDILNINILGVTMMTGTVLPGMVDRGKGAIINVGSGLSIYGCPYFTLYAASKAYMQSFTRDLAIEFKGSGIIFQYQYPAYVSTKMTRFQPNFAIPTAEQYANAGINSIGVEEETAVWITHKIFLNCFSFINNYGPSAGRNYAYDVMKRFWLFSKKKEIEKLGISMKDH